MSEGYDVPLTFHHDGGNEHYHDQDGNLISKEEGDKIIREQNEKKMKRIVIDGDMFRRLVAGKEVEQDGVKIILSDIGFGIMRQYINSAQEEPIHEKESV